MPSREQGVFGLYHSLHTRFLQVKMDSIGREGLVDDFGEDFGHLNSVFNFFRGNQMLGIY